MKTERIFRNVKARYLNLEQIVYVVRYIFYILPLTIQVILQTVDMLYFVNILLITSPS